MTASRRTLLAAAAALALPSVASTAPKRAKGPKACVGRVAYRGPPLRAQLGAWQLEAAAKAGSSRLAPITSDRLEAALEQAAGKMRTKALTAALATSDGAIWTQTLAGAPGDPLPGRFFWASVGKAYAATAILQMVEEGKLSLEATLDRWA
ncbi:serine hydrolase, partial [Phenylobacterium sp.]|uniref:serine hydrolase n=1 Tax=Phenylobacterium sp. TaxID=1871053 RepID=UPI00286C25E9